MNEPGEMYVERLAETGALDEAERLFAALDRGENPFVDSRPVSEVIAEARRRQTG